MTAVADVRKAFVVAVNEYPSGTWNVGHENVTFIDHGKETGTYGFNSQGRDGKGRFHPQGKIALQMPGGVFSEGHANAMTHYVIVSRSNYFSMLTFAQSQAELTTQKTMTYGLLTNNCADFVYRVFAHSDLPEKYRNISAYLKNKREPVAIYTERASVLYTNRSKTLSKSESRLEHDVVIVRLIDDALLYWPPFN